MELDRKQIIEDFERLVERFGENGSYNRYITVSDTLKLLKELIAENERLKTIPEQLHKEMSERMIEEVKVAKKYTVRRMQSDIKEACLKGGIWPAFVAGVVERVGEKILEENNVQVTD